MPSPKISDWLGSWAHPGGNIDIKRGESGKLSIERQQFVPTAHDLHTGEVQTQVAPQKGTLAFVDDGSIPFEKTDEGGCWVRMQRIGPWLMVEDNDSCGGCWGDVLRTVSPEVSALYFLATPVNFALSA